MVELKKQGFRLERSKLRYCVGKGCHVLLRRNKSRLMYVCVMVIALAGSTSIKCLYKGYNQTLGNQTYNSSLQTKLTTDDLTDEDRCDRFAYYSIDSNAGLGQRFGEMVFGIVFAFEQDAEFVLDKEAFLKTGSHGFYPWIEELLDMFDFKVLSEVKNRSDITYIHVPYREVSSAYVNHCNVIINAQNSQEACSYQIDPLKTKKKTNCFYTRIGDYNAVKLKLRRKFRLEKLCPMEVHERSTNEHYQYTAIWHLRTGDMILHENDQTYFGNLGFWKQIKPHLPRNYALQFVGEGGLASTFKFLGNLTGGELVDEPDSKRALCKFLTSDILIDSGSGFSKIAAVLSDPIFGPIIFQSWGWGDVKHRDSDYKFGMVLEVDDFGYITTDGKVVPPPSGYLLRNYTLTYQLREKIDDNVKMKANNYA